MYGVKSKRQKVKRCMGSRNSRERSALFKEKYTELKGKIKQNRTRRKGK